VVGGRDRSTTCHQAANQAIDARHEATLVDRTTGHLAVRSIGSRIQAREDRVRSCHCTSLSREARVRFGERFQADTTRARGRAAHHGGEWRRMSTEASPGQQVEKIGSKVRRLRTERGLSQDRLALESHVDQSGLSKFERGNRGLGRVPLTRVARVLGVSFEQLVSGTDFNATV
jgi:ribosome-binding protein aMBF1 (putative translation factor)